MKRDRDLRKLVRAAKKLGKSKSNIKKQPLPESKHKGFGIPDKPTNIPPPPSPPPPRFMHVGDYPLKGKRLKKALDEWYNEHPQYKHDRKVN